MHQLARLLLVSLLLCLLPSTSFAQTRVRKTRPSPAPHVICNAASVPRGMVVVGHKRNSACSSGSELIVKRPENGDIVCAESTLPAGFSRTAEAQGAATGTCPGKAFLIEGASPVTKEGGTGEGGAAAEARASRSGGDDAIARAFASGASNVQVEGEGTVSRVLPDDTNGARHQRFIVELPSGQTLLFAHNIDIAPRIPALDAGDSIRFSGEYIWNSKGGVIHWTHHDPQGRHVSGWLVHNGKTYR